MSTSNSHVSCSNTISDDSHILRRSLIEVFIFLQLNDVMMMSLADVFRGFLTIFSIFEFILFNVVLSYL